MDQRISKPQEPKTDTLYLETFFSTCVYYFDHPTAEETNRKLKKDINLWEKRDEKGIVRSNSLGWHSAVDMHHRKEYRPLTKELFKMQQEIYQAEGYHPNTEAICDNMWANVNYKYSHNKNHIHPGAQWSGVYYIKAPKDCGNIWFTDPCGERHVDMPIMADKKDKPIHYWREVYYQPIEGRLIMFPGWLTHEVAQNMCNLKGEKGWRVSVSFNFRQRWKRGMYVAKNDGHDSKGAIDSSSISI